MCRRIGGEDAKAWQSVDYTCSVELSQDGRHLLPQGPFDSTRNEITRKSLPRDASGSRVTESLAIPSFGVSVKSPGGHLACPQTMMGSGSNFNRSSWSPLDRHALRESATITEKIKRRSSRRRRNSKLHADINRRSFAKDKNDPDEISGRKPSFTTKQQKKPNKGQGGVTSYKTILLGDSGVGKTSLFIRVT